MTTQTSKSAEITNAARETGERDENYNLISVLYHALQGAETTLQYQRDAERSEDQELADFFQETKEAYTEFAYQAKRLLAARIEIDDEQAEEEEDDDA